MHFHTVFMLHIIQASEMQQLLTWQCLDLWLFAYQHI